MNILWFSIGSGPKQHGPAQQQLNRLLKEMMKEEDNLSPHLQSIAHEIQKQGEKSSIKNLSSAVPALGDAKQELLEAESARAQMLSQWKTFLQQSVVKWREFTASFQASESAHQQGVQAARYAVKRAQKAFGLASKREQAGKDWPYTISDSEDNDAADDAMEDPHGESVQRVQDGMSSIVTSSFSIKNHSAIGVPPFMETPISHRIHVCMLYIYMYGNMDLTHSG